MPDSKPEETPAPEVPAESPEGPRKKGSMAPPNMLNHDSDHAVRPGFRSPANTRSKAQKAQKKKKK